MYNCQNFQKKFRQINFVKEKFALSSQFLATKAFESSETPCIDLRTYTNPSLSLFFFSLSLSPSGRFPFLGGDIRGPLEAAGASIIPLGVSIVEPVRGKARGRERGTCADLRRGTQARAMPVDIVICFLLFSSSRYFFPFPSYLSPIPHRK